MKKLIFLLMALLPALAVWAEVGDEFNVDGLKYKVTSEDPKTVELTGYDGEKPTGDLLIPSTVNGYSVTSIGEYAIRDCSDLISITIPASVTSIGYQAFRYCTNLTSITIPEGVTSIGESAFLRCTSLTSITIPNSVTSIGKYAFSSCTSLTSIIIPNSVTSIPNNAFMGCSGLTSITIPNSVTSIGTSAFSRCSSLTSITIPESITSIGNNVFYDCSGLTSIFVATGNEYFASIDGVLFDKDMKTLLIYPAGNTATSYTIPASVTSIGSNAFRTCINLTSVTIPEGVTQISSSAFSGCTEIANIFCYADPEVLTWYEDANAFKPNSQTLCHVESDKLDVYNEKFGGLNVTFVGDLNQIFMADGLIYKIMGESQKTVELIGYNEVKPSGDLLIPTTVNDYSVTGIGNSVFKECSSLTSVSIPASVTSIGDSAFKDCTGLESVIFTDVSQLTDIGANAFNACRSLTSVTIPDGVTSIEDGAFMTCESLTSITIPASVTSIGDSAFEGCTGLESVIFTDGSQLTDIGANAFNACRSLTSVTIPDGVTSIGEAAFYKCTGLTSIIVADENEFFVTIDGVLFDKEKKTIMIYPAAKTATSYIIPEGVESIDSYAFYGCSGLTTVTIPDGVTSIEDGAFMTCESLTSITIPASVTRIGSCAFYGCTGLTSLNFAESSQLMSIGNQAFQYCTGLTSVTIPSSVVGINIRDAAFYGCSGLTSVTILPLSAYIEEGVFEECKNLTDVYCYADPEVLTWNSNQSEFKPNKETQCHVFCYKLALFNNNLKGVNVTFVGDLDQNLFLTVDGLIYKIMSESPETVELIGYDGEKPTGDLTIPATVNGYSVTSIGNSVFKKCSSLTSVSIPTCVTSVGGSAFMQCRGLTSIVFAEGSQLTSIGNYAFDKCTGLTTVTIPEGVTSIGSAAFGSCTGLTTITIPASVMSFGEFVFSGCDGLTSILVATENEFFASIDGVLFDKNVKTIIAYPAGKTASSYTIPASVTCIGESAFEGCSSLISINIPASVKSIDGGAFWNCFNLTSVDFTEGSQLTSISESTFWNCSKLISVNIPDGVTSIGQNAFYGCSSLTSITIPASVTNINNYAFQNCRSVTDIYCYANWEVLTWDYAYSSFKYNNKTLCHVEADKLDAYKEKFSNINVTFVGDLPEGIENLTADSSKSNAIYNLRGQRINGLVRGVNVVDGKKVMVR